MANTYKNILVYPNRSSDTYEPNIQFRGANSGSNVLITATMLPDANGTLSFHANSGQLFSISNDLTGTIFSVNDISGVPSLEIDANGMVKLAEFSGNVGIGTGNANYRLTVSDSNVRVTLRVTGNGNTAGYRFETLNATATIGTAGIYAVPTGPITDRYLGLSADDSSYQLKVSANALSQFSGNVESTGLRIVGVGQVVAANGVWVGSPTNLQGPQGTTGSQGLQGPQGLTGTGSQGTTGTGAQGIQGIQGIQGRQGPQGSTGPSTGINATAYTSGTYLPVMVLTTGSVQTPYAHTTLSYSSGTLSATDFSATSDARLKNIIGFIGDASLKLEGVKGVYYKWNEMAKSLGYDERRGNREEVGLLAQEIQAILPQAVYADEKGFLSISYDRLIPVLIEAIKEQGIQIKNLQNRITTLEDKVK